MPSGSSTNGGGSLPGTQSPHFGTQDLEMIAAKLSDPLLDIKGKVTVASELRETIELYQRELDPTKFFDLLLPCFVDILRTGKVYFNSNNMENRLRNLILQILHRLPHIESLRPHTGNLMAILLRLLRGENEENAVLVMKIILDLHRAFARGPGSEPSPVEATVDDFLDIIVDVFKAMPAAVEEHFGNNASASVSPTPGILYPANKSFKLIQDCPAAIVFIFQTYRKRLPKPLERFVPIIFDFIQLEAAPQAAMHRAMPPGRHWTGIAPSLPREKRGMYTDLITAQTKTMSFLAYSMRSSITIVAAYTDLLPSAAVRLMKDCPTEAVPMKRDLLIAVRHILQTDFRTAFIGQIATLLHDDVLVGSGVTGHETLRPLAYSMLADLIHHVRQELSLEQLTEIVQVYSANIHDPTLASAIQTMCSKLLLNLIDPITSRDKEGRVAVSILRRMLRTFVSKIEAMALMRDDWRKYGEERPPLPQTLDGIAKFNARGNTATVTTPGTVGTPGTPGTPSTPALEDRPAKVSRSAAAKDISEGSPAAITAAEDAMVDDSAVAVTETGADATNGGDSPKKRKVVTFSDPIDDATKVPDTFTLDAIDIERSKIIHRSSVVIDPGATPLNDARFLFKNLLFGYKTISSTIVRIQAGNGMSTVDTSCDVFKLHSNSVEDVELMSRFYEGAVRCLSMYDSSKDQRDYKEIIEVFSSTLVQSDIQLFQEVVDTSMELLFSELVANYDLLVIPQSLLSNESVSQQFVSLLFRFLQTKLSRLGNKKSKEYAFVVLRLYKMAFMSITIYPEKNEPVLLPYLAKLITSSLDFAYQAVEPNSYYLLLRSLFRSIGGGRFDTLYNEVLPLLHELLERLNALLESTADKNRRDLIAELILTVPVRLSVLLPYLPYLMRPLMHALNASNDLVTQGLRTLELCVDNISHDYLLPTMATVIDDVMATLWRMLRPVPFSHQQAHTAMRILAKLGGRNRRGYETPPFAWRVPSATDDDASLVLAFADNERVSLDMAPLVGVASRIIRRGDVHYKRMSFNFLRSSALVLVRRRRLPDGAPLETFALILQGLFDATKIDDFATEAHDFLLQVAEFIFAAELAVDAPENVLNLKQAFPFTSALVDGIIENACRAENHELERVEDQTTQLVDALLRYRKTTAVAAVSGRSSRIDDPAMSILHQMGSRFCTQCYNALWQRKTGAALGLRILTQNAHMPVVWVRSHQIEFVRGLLFSLKDMPGEAAANSEIVTDSFLHILRVTAQSGVRDDSTTGRAQFNYLIGLLLIEMCSQVSVVRRTVKRGLEILAEATETPLTDMLMPVRDRLISPIFTKPLRALGIPLQIGHIDAVTFCISLNPPLIDFNDQMVRLLHEALAIADAEDVSLLGGKQPSAKQMKPLTQLRVVCVQVLSAAMASPAMAAFADHPPIQDQVLFKVYFKLLYAQQPDVAEAAFQGLKRVMVTQGKLPRPSLQEGLKPVLMNLGDHRKLTVDNMKGLSRLLELLTSYFKVEIGHKLVSHLKSLAVPVDIQRYAISQPPQKDGRLEVIASIIDVFYLLPHPAAKIFLDDVMTAAVNMERFLKKKTRSIFTAPLGKYARLYPAETNDFFLARIGDMRFVPTYLAILASEHAEPLVDHLRTVAAERFPVFFQQQGDAAYHAALVLRTLVDRGEDERREWLVTNPLAIDVLTTRWLSDTRRARLADSGDVHAAQLKEDTIVVGLFLDFLRLADRVDLLFHMMDLFMHCRASHTNVLVARFLTEHVILGHNVRLKHDILHRFIDLYDNASLTKTHKATILGMLVNPLLLIAFSRHATEGDAVVDGAFVKKVHATIWQPLLAVPVDTGVASFDDEALRIELCHMSTLVLKVCQNIAVEFKKDIIKFGWVNIKLDDVLAIQTAYVLVAAFIQRFDSPSKIVGQIYVALLKSYQAEGRALVREALDTLAPTLPERMGNFGTDGTPHSTWARWTRRIIVEDSGGIPLLVNIYQLIVRHAELYFPSRDLFIPHMVSSLTKLTLSPASAPDSRALTLDVIELIIIWEKRRVAVDPDGFSVPQPLRDQIVNNLLRFIANSQESMGGTGRGANLVTRAIGILRELFSSDIWPDMNIKLTFFIKTFSVDSITSAESLTLMCNSAEVLNVVATHKPRAWIIENLETLHFIVQKGYSFGESRLHGCLKVLLEKLFQTAAEPEEGPKPDTPAELDSEAKPRLGNGDVKAESQPTDAMDVDSVAAPGTPPEDKMDVDASVAEPFAAFTKWATTTVTEGLRTPTNLLVTITILQAWCKASAEVIDQFIPLLVRVFTRLTREHIGAGSAANASAAEPQLRLIISIIDMMRIRISYLGDNRRWFLSAIVQLIEKSASIDVCRFVLQMVRRWVLDDKAKVEAYPSLREKSGILLKMMSFDTRNSDVLMKDYLTLILDIYSDASLARSELTFKLEPAFLLGCRSRDPVMRSRFMDVFDQAIPKPLFSRLHYILGVQNWDTMGETYWIYQALDTFIGGAARDISLFDPPNSQQTFPPDMFSELEKLTTGDILDATRRLLYADPNATQQVWISVFRSTWNVSSRRDQQDIIKDVVSVLSKEYHLRSVDRRPSAVHTLVSGLNACPGIPPLPPQLLRYLARTFNAWYPCIELLQANISNSRTDQFTAEASMDALAELYSEMSEDDLFYGLWRRRATLDQTNTAISWEQAGLWPEAQALYEAAQLTARSGQVHFSESELSLWEDHWVLAAQKLQNWEILAELAHHEGNKELLLECKWNTANWQDDRESLEQIVSSCTNNTPRRRVFEAFLTLIKLDTVQTSIVEGGESEVDPGQKTALEELRKSFQQSIEEGTQIALRKWFYLPEIFSQAHVPLLQTFQLFLELQEAQTIFSCLAVANTSNPDSRSSELKTILSAWRDRLPNTWDDISIWNDLVSWRQHMFDAINKAYKHMTNPGANAGNQGTSSFAYRGYHETAWITNRLAHVARKHHLNEVCIDYLNKIYALPNIEIQEAFLKLREQAKCNYPNVSDLASGLEVINNTNLMYFTASQKSEFYTLKGMFLTKMKLYEDANQSYNSAISMDTHFPKAWSKWGAFHDKMFKQNPTEMHMGSSAVNCYLQAAGLYKSDKSRKLLLRVIWLLGLDDNSMTISKMFEQYTGEIPTWYWITFIPQLLSSLSHREARLAKAILVRIAKQYPQALFFLLRTNRDELANLKKQHTQQNARLIASRGTPGESTDSPAASGIDGMHENGGETPLSANGVGSTANGGSTNGSSQSSGSSPLPPWEHVDEILSTLKTAFPLLALTMELLVDQITSRFKAFPEDDVYRLINALLSDSLQQYIKSTPNADGKTPLPTATETTIARFVETLHPESIRPQFERDFILAKPSLREYIRRLQDWRDRYEAMLTIKMKRSNLESISHWLVEFQYQKFDELEVPGQYLALEDNNSHFVRINHFNHKFTVTRANGAFFKRITIVGHDGSQHEFAAQSPPARACRREERMMQLFRMLSSPLLSKKETRKRNLKFFVPDAIPFAPQFRLFKADSSFTSLQDIYENHCERLGIVREHPVLANIERIHELQRLEPSLSKSEIESVRQEITEEISVKMVPDHVLKDYVTKMLNGPKELFHFRKVFTHHMAEFIFLSHILSVNARVPNRIQISRSTGKMYSTEMLPSYNQATSTFSLTEQIPFRYTPNFQRLITPIGTEGLLMSSVMAIARALTQSEDDLEHRLSLFIREELSAWLKTNTEALRTRLRDTSNSNVDAIVEKARLLSCQVERDRAPSAEIPVNQSILELFARATHPRNISSMEPTYYPWL